MIINEVHYVKEDKYISKISKIDSYIAKVEIGKYKEENVEIIKRIYNSIGCTAYDDLEKLESNYDALNDYLSDLSYGVSNEYQAIEVYIQNLELIDPKFVTLLEQNIKEHEYNVAKFSGGSQKIMSIDIYIKS